MDGNAAVLLSFSDNATWAGRSLD